MAEFVQQRKELAIFQYETMKRIKLFDNEEMVRIKKTREKFEYKLEKQTKDLRDYCEYIQYERGLLGIINDRRLIRHIKEKKALERVIANNIHLLYSKAVFRFPGDLRLWESFVKFCRGTHFTSSIPEIHDRMLRLHSSKPEVWLKAIIFEYSDLQNMWRIKHLLTSALQMHPKDRELNKTFIQIELLEAQTISDSEERTDEQKEKEVGIALGHCETLYRSLKASMDLDFFIELLQLSLQFPFAHPFSRKILMDVYQEYRNHPKVWNCFAQSELTGVSLFDPAENAPGIVRGPRSVKTNIEKCVEVFEFAAKQLPCQEIFGLFVDSMLELNQNMAQGEQKLRRLSLARALASSHEKGFMTEKHYLIYLRLLLEADSINTGKMEEVFSAALKSNSVQVWKLRLTYGIKHEPKEQLQDLFRRVSENVSGDDVLEIYKLMFAFLSCSADSKAAEEFLETAIKHQNRGVALHFKPEYIEWVALHSGMSEARRIYKDLALNSAPCLGLHQRMIALEKTSVPVSVVEVRRCFDYALQLFGFKEVSIWVDYIRFERESGDPMACTNLYQRAKSTLKGAEAVQQFIEEHNLMQLEDE